MRLDRTQPLAFIKMNQIGRIAAFFGLMLSVVSCGDDIGDIGSGLIDDNALEIQSVDDFSVKTYSTLLSPVQTNGLPSYRLGSYVDPVYGTTDYHAAMQFNLSAPDPSFGENPQVHSVVLEIPYFSTRTGIMDEVTTYELDSIYGTEPIRLEVLENGFFFSALDVDDPTMGAAFYSDIKSSLDNNAGTQLYDDAMFMPSAEELVVPTLELDDTGMVVNGEEERLSPRLRVPIANPAYWQALIIDNENTDVLLNNNNFRSFFKGLYLRTDAGSMSTDPILAHLDLDAATITITYTFQREDRSDEDEDGNTTELITDLETYVLNAAPSIVNAYENDYDAGVIAAIQNSDPVAGDERVYLKGGEGSVGIIELFGEDADMDGEADELTVLRENNWLINEVNLTLFVDQDAVGNPESEPERILIFDYDNNLVLADYLSDTAVFVDENSINSRVNNLGRLVRNDTENGVSYRMRLTQHLRDILENEEQDNVRLGISVSQNINQIGLSRVLNSTDPEFINTGSVISHEGTVLHGGNSQDLDKRMRLEIFYTLPE